MPAERAISAGDKLKYLVAIVGAGVYLYAAYLLYGLATDTTTTADVWTRTSFVFNGITSIGLASIGILLGVTIQQVKVSEAKAQTTEAKAQTTEAMADARSKRDAASKALGALSGAGGSIGSGMSASKEDRHAAAVATARSILEESLRSP